MLEKMILASMLFGTVTILSTDYVFAVDPVDALQEQINALQSDLRSSEKATYNLIEWTESIQEQVQSAQNEKFHISEQMKTLTQNIETNEKSLVEKEKALALAIVKDYKSSHSQSTFLAFLKPNVGKNALRSALNHRAARRHVQNQIDNLTADISQMHDYKENLLKTQKNLLVQEIKLKEQLELNANEIDSAKNYQKGLAVKTKELRRLQEEARKHN